MTPACPFQPSKSCKDSGKHLFYPVDYKNSISNSFSFIMRKRPRQLSGAQQPWNKERVSTDPPPSSSEPAQPFILCPCCGMASQLLWRKKPKPSERWAVKVQTLLQLLSHSRQGVLVATPDQWSFFTCFETVSAGNTPQPAVSFLGWVYKLLCWDLQVLNTSTDRVGTADLCQFVHLRLFSLPAAMF